MFGLRTEADVSWASYATGETCNAVAATVQCNSKSDRFGTFAGRLGIAADRTLVYFKGGAAWTHDIHDLVLCCGVVEATVSGGKWGWTAGTGLEYALTRNWSAKLEYDFMDFGTSRFVFDVPTVGGTGTATTEIRATRPCAQVQAGTTSSIGALPSPPATERAAGSSRSS